MSSRACFMGPGKSPFQENCICQVYINIPFMPCRPLHSFKVRRGVCCICVSFDVSYSLFCPLFRLVLFHVNVENIFVFIIACNQRILNDLWRNRDSRRRMLWLLPDPLSPVSKLDRRHRGRLRKRDNLLTG
jgi:hypothetical protein